MRESQSSVLTSPSSFKYLNPQCFPLWVFDPIPKPEWFCPRQIPRETIHLDASKSRERKPPIAITDREEENTAGKLCRVFVLCFPDSKMRR